MSNAIRTSRRVILLGAVISLAVPGLSSTRPVSKAQEPAKATDKKALRELIIALHGEIDLLEVEQGIDRQLLTESIKLEKECLAQFAAYFENKRDSLQEPAWSKFGSAGGWYCSGLASVKQTGNEELKKILSVENQGFKDSILEEFGQEFAAELDALAKIEEEEKFSEFRKHLADRVQEHVMKKATESFRQETEPLKKEFARRSAELAGKRLDLDTLERRYREAR